MSTAAILSPAEQESQVARELRRSKGIDRKSAKRRELLTRLVDFAHSSHSSLKKFAAQNFRDLFSDFPDLEDDVINAIYDLCEDPDTQVRMKGYEAINDVSAAEPKWVKRNADVLVQLLQTDDQNEVVQVKKALSRHMDLDLSAAWGVFCDQIAPTEDPIDDDESESRERIRTLVLAYLASEARPHIARHAAKSENEDIIINGLLRCIGRVETQDVRTIIYEVLLLLSSYSFLSIRGAHLLDTVLSKLRKIIENSSQQNIDNTSVPIELSDDTTFYLDIATDLAVRRRTAHPHYLARFFLDEVLLQPLFSHLANSWQLLFISRTAEALSAEEEVKSIKATPTHASSPTELRLSNEQIEQGCIVAFEALVTANSLSLDSLEPCRNLLTLIQDRQAASSLLVSDTMASSLHRLQTWIEGFNTDDTDVNFIKNVIFGLIKTISSSGMSASASTSRERTPIASTPHAPPARSGVKIRRRRDHGLPVEAAVTVEDDQRAKKPAPPVPIAQLRGLPPKPEFSGLWTTNSHNRKRRKDREDPSVDFERSASRSSDSGSVLSIAGAAKKGVAERGGVDARAPDSTLRENSTPPPAKRPRNEGVRSDRNTTPAPSLLGRLAPTLHTSATTPPLQSLSSGSAQSRQTGPRRNDRPRSSQPRPNANGGGFSIKGAATAVHESQSTGQNLRDNGARQKHASLIERVDSNKRR